LLAIPPYPCCYRILWRDTCQAMCRGLRPAYAGMQAVYRKSYVQLSVGAPTKS